MKTLVALAALAALTFTAADANAERFFFHKDKKCSWGAVKWKDCKTKSASPKDKVQLKVF